MPDSADTHFVVFTTQRSGSTWLISVLNGLENVTAHSEVLLPRPRTTERRWDSDFSYPRYIESKSEHGSVRPFSLYRYLDELYNVPGAVGFKLMYSQVKSYPEVIPYLMRKRIRAVHLVRRNHLDVLISFQLKRSIGKAHILSPGDRPKDLSIDLDTTTLVKDLEKLQFRHNLGRRLLRMSRLPHLEVAYEDLVREQARFDEVLAFLGLPVGQALPESAILKTRTGGQNQVVRNYDEVRSVLRSSEFAGLLE
jgi:LPS sulfotransferase NodH